MKYLKEKTIHQIDINKSIFIGILYPLTSEADISLCLNDAKESFPKANHYCSASIFGDTGEHQTASDDGEPSRTAGIPILEVLKHHDVTNILCVVVRFFGGIKLGAGGLLRAYTKASADVIKLAKFYQKKTVPSYEITFGYHLINQMDQFLNEKATIVTKSFLTNVTYKIIVNADTSLLTDISHQLIGYKELPSETIFIDS
ncbi:MAG: YigZ family protein [Acholeplasmataceae bacterium]|nr:YigZ family protein [Acholeplasmataceae bacterium]